MSLPRYPEYKDSGVGWLGQVPSHWQLCRLKDVAEVVNGFPFDSKLFVADGGYPLIRIRDLDAQEATTRYIGEFVPSAAVSASDILIGMDGDFNVGRWLGDEVGLLNQRMCCIRASSTALSTFLRHGLPIPLKAINDVTYSTTVKHLSSFDIEKIRFALPNREELTAIATFLDRETGKIDTLIAEQEKLLTLLAEKRQATISHAVTKGLKPDASMKDSGVAWLGEVPEHWAVVPLMHLTHPSRPIMYGIVLPGPDVEQGVPIVKGGDVKEHRLKVELLNRTTVDIEAPYARARLKPMDIVYSIRGTIGDAEVVPVELEGANITQDVARISPADGVQTRWLLHVMKSKPVFIQLEQRSLGAAVRGINIFELKRARIPVPPSAERDRIAHFLDEETTKLDRLRAESERNIQLLKERRSALIASAVTGQIDVRDI